MRDDGPWRPVVAQVAEKFLACGVLEHGFARMPHSGLVEPEVEFSALSDQRKLTNPVSPIAVARNRRFCAPL
jgi:hypothetical protein